MSETIKELEHVLSVVENDIEYYDKKYTQTMPDGPKGNGGFYRGGKAALVDVKNYLEKEIKRIKITDKFEKENG